ncbi:hypothetical protein Hanom_Chr01g00006071 [Helianthus anomalus]
MQDRLSTQDRSFLVLLATASRVLCSCQVCRWRSFELLEIRPLIEIQTR